MNVRKAKPLRRISLGLIGSTLLLAALFVCWGVVIGHAREAATLAMFPVAAVALGGLAAFFANERRIKAH